MDNAWLGTPAGVNTGSGGTETHPTLGAWSDSTKALFLGTPGSNAQANTQPLHV
jgi:hypothetical protein